MLENSRWVKSKVHAFLQKEPSGHWFSISHPHYTTDAAYVQAGQGTYSADEWSEVRRSRQGETSLDLDGDFFSMMMSTEPRKVASALSLVRNFPFERYGSILELGAGEMIHAAVIKNSRPKVRYTATDYDPYVIQCQAKIPLLSGIEKRVLDVTQLTAADLEGSKLVTSFGFEYALSDSQLLNVFERCREVGAEYLMGSASTTNLTRWLRFLWKRTEINANVDKGKFRQHGHMRSTENLRRIARQGGMKLRPLGWHADYEVFHFCSEGRVS